MAGNFSLLAASLQERQRRLRTGLPQAMASGSTGVLGSRAVTSRNPDAGEQRERALLQSPAVQAYARRQGKARFVSRRSRAITQQRKQVFKGLV
jgi:hypothetical protein